MTHLEKRKLVLKSKIYHTNKFYSDLSIIKLYFILKFNNLDIFLKNDYSIYFSNANQKLTIYPKGPNTSKRDQIFLCLLI